MESRRNHRVQSGCCWTSLQGTRNGRRSGGGHTTRNRTDEPPVSAVSTRWPAFHLLCPRRNGPGRLCRFPRRSCAEAARQCGCRGGGLPGGFASLSETDHVVCSKFRLQETRAFRQSVSGGRTGCFRCSNIRTRIFRNLGHGGLPDRLRRRNPAIDVAGSIRQKRRRPRRSRPA